ncbi:MAG: phosphoribosylanthranilate isomerase [Phormidesmis sp.]
MLQVKICGITRVEQGQAITQLGATALGYICVEQSPRYITPEKIAAITADIAAVNPEIEHFGVFADAPLTEMLAITQTAGLGVIQLHGDETTATCQLLRDALKMANLPHVKLVKAMRIRAAADLAAAIAYEPYVDTLLLDAYDPQQLGGTGHTLDWRSLQTFTPNRPWFLAGGLRPDNVRSALAQLSPSGIDLSSGVEKSPGDKDLAKVRQLFEQIRQMA